MKQLWNIKLNKERRIKKNVYKEKEKHTKKQKKKKKTIRRKRFPPPKPRRYLVSFNMLILHHNSNGVCPCTFAGKTLEVAYTNCINNEGSSN